MTFRQTILKTVQWALVALVLWFVVPPLYRGVAGIDKSQVCFSPIRMAMALVLTAASVPAAAAVLGWIYRAHGYPLSFSRAMALFTIPQMGKYLPGKIATLAGHVGMARAFGVPMRASGSAVTFFMAVNIAAQVLLGLLLMALAPLPGAYGADIRLISLALLAAALVCLHPRVYFAAVNLMLKLLRRPRLQSGFTIRDMAMVLAGIMAHALLYCFGFVLMGAAIVKVSPVHFTTLGAGLIMSNIAGFIAVFAPAGIGVREGIFMTMASSLMTVPQAALIAVVTRIWATLTDIIMAGAAALMMAAEKRSGGKREPS